MADTYDDDNDGEDLTFRGGGEDILAAIARESTQRNALPARGIQDDDDDTGDPDDDASGGSFLDDAEVPPAPASLQLPQPKRRGRPPKNRDVNNIPIPASAVHHTQPPESDDEMSRRNRSRNGMTSQPNHQQKRLGLNAPVLREAPLQDIEDAMANGVELVSLRISGRNSKGHLASVRQETRAIQDLASAETWLTEELGGGKWFLDPRDINNPVKRVVPAFELEIHAPVKININQNGVAMPGGLNAGMGAGLPPAMGMSGAMPVGMGGMPGMDPRTMPPFIRGSDPVVQAAWAQAQMPAHTQPVMTYTPDQIATTELSKAQEQLTAERKQRELERKQTEATFAQLRASIDQLGKSVLEERQKSQEREHKLELQQIREETRRRDEEFKRLLAEAKDRKPAFDLAGFAAVASAFAPVLVGFIDSNKQTAARTLEMQMQSNNRVLEAAMKTADSKPMFDSVMGMLPIITPLVKGWLENKGPTAQAKLVESLAEHNMTQMGFLAEFIKQISDAQPDGPPAWLPFAQDAIKGVMQVAEGITRSSKQAVGIPTQQPQQRAPQPAVQQYPQLTPAQAASGEAPRPYLPFTGAQVRGMIESSPQIPPDLKTEAWLNIIEGLHDRAPVEDVAEAFADHIRTIPDDKLPEVFAGFWDNGRAVLTSAFQQLPIWQYDPAYAQAFVEAAIVELTGDDTVDPAAQPQEPETVPVSMFTTIPQQPARVAQKAG